MANINTVINEINDLLVVISTTIETTAQNLTSPIVDAEGKVQVKSSVAPLPPVKGQPGPRRIHRWQIQEEPYTDVALEKERFLFANFITPTVAYLLDIAQLETSTTFTAQTLKDILNHLRKLFLVIHGGNGGIRAILTDQDVAQLNQLVQSERFQEVKRLVDNKVNVFAQSQFGQDPNIQPQLDEIRQRVQQNNYGAAKFLIAQTLLQQLQDYQTVLSQVIQQSNTRSQQGVRLVPDVATTVLSSGQPMPIITEINWVIPQEAERIRSKPSEPAKAQPAPPAQVIKQPTFPSPKITPTKVKSRPAPPKFTVAAKQPSLLTPIITPTRTKSRPPPPTVATPTKTTTTRALPIITPAKVKSRPAPPKYTIPTKQPSLPSTIITPTRIKSRPPPPTLTSPTLSLVPKLSPRSEIVKSTMSVATLQRSTEGALTGQGQKREVEIIKLPQEEATGKLISELFSLEQQPGESSPTVEHQRQEQLIEGQEQIGQLEQQVMSTVQALAEDPGILPTALFPPPSKKRKLILLEEEEEEEEEADPFLSTSIFPTFEEEETELPRERKRLRKKRKIEKSTPTETIEPTALRLKEKPLPSVTEKQPFETFATTESEMELEKWQDEDTESIMAEFLDEAIVLQDTIKKFDLQQLIQNLEYKVQDINLQFTDKDSPVALEAVQKKAQYVQELNNLLEQYQDIADDEEIPVYYWHHVVGEAGQLTTKTLGFGPFISQEQASADMNDYLETLEERRGGTDRKYFEESVKNWVIDVFDDGCCGKQDNVTVASLIVDISTEIYQDYDTFLASLQYRDTPENRQLFERQSVSQQLSFLAVGLPWGEKTFEAFRGAFEKWAQSFQPPKDPNDHNVRVDFIRYFSPIIVLVWNNVLEEISLGASFKRLPVYSENFYCTDPQVDCWGVTVALYPVEPEQPTDLDKLANLMQQNASLFDKPMVSTEMLFLSEQEKQQQLVQLLQPIISTVTGASIVVRPVDGYESTFALNFLFPTDLSRTDITKVVYRSLSTAINYGFDISVVDSRIFIEGMTEPLGISIPVEAPFSFFE